MKLELLQPWTLSDAEISALKRLTLGRKHGTMLETLEDYQYIPGTRVIRLTDCDGRILSWALVVPYPSTRNKKRKDLNIYTRASERNKGYGRIVYQKAVQVAQGRKNLVVHPNDKNRPFFNKVHKRK